MALIVGCDVCGKFVKTIPWEKRSEIHKLIICPDCEKKEKALDSYIDKAKKRVEHQLNQIYESAKKELNEMITTLANENKKE